MITALLIKILRPVFKTMIQESLVEILSESDTKLKLNKVILKNKPSNIDKFIHACSSYEHEIKVNIEMVTEFTSIEERIECINFADMIRLISQSSEDDYVKLLKIPKEDVIGISKFDIQCWYQYAGKRNLVCLYLIEQSSSLSSVNEVKVYVNRLATKHPELML
jgi:hypothetical protein